MSESTSSPISTSNRLVNIDIIRGVALLGILIMNIQAFSMIFAAYSNPTAYGDLTGVNYYVYYFSHLLADQKFMSIFSLLFGVGIVLMADNIERKGQSPRKIHFTRMFILALFGLAHAYLLWFGDILFAYAIAGMIIYGARNKSPRFLFILAFCLISVCSLIMWAASFSLPYMQPHEIQEMQMFWAPDAETVQKDLSANLSSWIGQTDIRNKMAATMQGNIVFYMFRIIGLMAIGMALYKMDFFGERFSKKALMSTGVIALISGLALIAYGNQLNFAAGWPLESMLSGIQYNYWGSMIVAYSYLAFLIVFCRTNAFGKVKSVLANVGRMALTNYLMQSFICGFIFYGWGLGFYGSAERFEQLVVVLGVWAFQLSLSTFWMNRFKFGPFEWVWRSLTYRQLQPLKR